ncbi:MAG: anaerobic ribonucleoside-triphosphate reductase [Candidatus Diapherotrites archaeon]|nr:anaerobic ribonucleoside-triphosphate reductase [Candidatus Diapherotrites archaeon]
MKYHSLFTIKVRTNNMEIESFDRDRIAESLTRETGLSTDLSNQISSSVEEELQKLKLDFVSAPLIRELVDSKLIESGLEKARLDYTRLGMPVYDVNKLIDGGSTENANLQHNPETIHKLIADSVMREYTLIKVLDRNQADAHMNGAIHIHDLDYFPIRPFCFSHDIRFFLKNGFKADGRGLHTATSKPAKHYAVAMSHAAKVLAAAQTNFAGGQGFSWFNILMSPFLEGKSYSDYKQAAQIMIYEMSQMYVARGGQVVFSSINIQPDVPKTLEDIPAVLPGGKVTESKTYADYADETHKLFDAFIDVYTEGDALEKPFSFPKCEVTYNPKIANQYEDSWMKVSELAAKFGTPYYFINQPYLPEFACYQCCAYLMPLSDQTTESDLHNGTVRGGALQVVTLNLPRIGLESGGDDNKLFELMRERAELARDMLIKKQEVIKKRLSSGVLPFLSQPIDEKGTLYYDLDEQALEIGFIGLNEMLLNHMGEELHSSKEAWDFGLKTINTLKEIVADIAKETGKRFVLSRTPAESASYRLPKIDIKKYPNAHVQGNKNTEDIYYTNGAHVRPSADIGLFDRMKIESSFHPLLSGGTMNHMFLGEANPSPIAINELTKKIAKNTLASYFAYTKDYTLCSDCSKVSQTLVDKCSHCNSTNVEGYSRITGYVQKVSSWNKGKQQELRDRQKYSVSSSSMIAKAAQEQDSSVAGAGAEEIKQENES